MSLDKSQQSWDESTDYSPSSSVFPDGRAEPIEIDGRDNIYSVTFLVDERHIVTGGQEKQIRCWQVEDGKEVGPPMDARSSVLDIAVSPDGKWLVSGTSSGEVTVWNAVSHQKAIVFKEHKAAVYAVDVSPDGTRIVTGSDDKTVCVWSLATGARLLGPLEHLADVVGVKFSPDGCFIATVTWSRNGVRVHDSRDGRILFDVPIRIGSSQNRSLTWTSDSKQLFVLSRDGNIHRLDVSDGATISQRPIHGSTNARCIALACDGTFIVASAESSISFWDATTLEQIGPVIAHSARLTSIAISANCDLVIGGGRTITVRSLRGILPSSYTSREETLQLSKAELADLENTIEDLRAREESSNGHITRLEETNEQLRNELSDSQNTIGSLHSRIANLEETNQQLSQTLRAHEQKYTCEALYAEGHIIDAARCLLDITVTITEYVRTNSVITDWLAKFKQQCLSMLETIGDEALNAEKHDEAAAAYSTALSLTPSTPNALLTKWATMALAHDSPNDALSAAAEFKLSSFVIFRVICDVLEEDGRVLEAVKFFQLNILGIETNSMDETEWVADFKARCLKVLDQRGGLAMKSTSYQEATSLYTTALTLEPQSTDLLTKRSKAQAGIGSWQESLKDADAVITLDPSSPRGYERKHAALLGVRRFDEAIDVYNEMLLKLEQSPDPDTRELRNHYVSPSQTIDAVRSSAERTQRDTPLVLIDIETGRLHDKRGRLDQFEADSTFKELIASMTTALDDSRISQAVREYFRYGTFSHTWEGTEPLFHDVLHESIHKLAESPTAFKLLMFCATVREAGLRWAWSDTCCINKADGSVLQESLTSMFQWYNESALTIIHLKGVLSDSDLRVLERCLWNTRAWTLQEFFASKVIRFYTEDWKPYFPHESVYNHKESLVIMAEMAAATGVDAQVLLTLRPGSENVRQKLCLAAARIATKQEDIAYSLFGIFDVSISINYGEGQQRALGRLLQEVLTRSGDVTILAWTGRASDYNSCLPAEIGVYREPASPYISSAIPDDKMDALAEELRASTYVNSTTSFYDQVIRLPSPRLVSRRLSLSCIEFPLRGLSVLSEGSPRVYRAVTSALGNVEIKTTADLSGMQNLILVNPWLQALLDPAHPSKEPIVPVDDEAAPLTPVDEEGGDNDPDALSPLLSPSTSPSYDKLTRSLRLFARLRQPFGALLLNPLSHNEFQRVACDHPIVVQLLKNVSPRYLMEKLRTLDVL